MQYYAAMPHDVKLLYVNLQPSGKVSMKVSVVKFQL